MSDSVLSTLPVAGDENLPLPLLVAKKWDFSLTFTTHEEEMYYAVQDWIRGLSDGSSRQVANIWVNFKSKTHISNVTLPYVATDGKTYQRDLHERQRALSDCPTFARHESAVSAG